jgi:hypothetical protein
MMNVAVLIVIMLNVVIPNVIMLIVFIQNVVVLYDNFLIVKYLMAKR